MKLRPQFLSAVALLTMTLCAQGATVSSNPASGATGVSVTTPVVFTFSAAMNTSMSQAIFTTTTPAGLLSVTTMWSAGNTVLTCTPDSPWPDNSTITWNVVGFDGTGGTAFANGTFSTGTGGGGGGVGSGTNKITTFSVGKLYLYQQDSAGAPAPHTITAYALSTATSVASNLASTASTVTLPTGGAPLNMNQSPEHHEDYNLFVTETNQATFETTYPQGNYAFNVTATPANAQGTVNMPASMTQPPAPHVSNFAAAQAIDVTKAFTLNWDPFQGGTANDYIGVTVNGDMGNVLFATPGPGTNGALTGTVTSVVIPAGKLPANSTNTTEVVFYHFLATSNATIATVAFRASGTELSLIGAGGSTGGTVPVVSNPVWGANGFEFDVATSPRQALKVLSSTDCSVPVTQWPTVATTNSTGSSVHIIIAPQGGTNGFYRVANGP